MLNIDIRHLKYFESVARNRNFTKASEELHISQPSLSSQIKVLEQELGFPLFERSTKVVNLTESGRLFYTLGNNVLREYNNIYNEIDNIRETGSGIINIGLIDSTKYWIPYVLNQFNNKYPNVSVNFKSMGTREMEKALENYEIHFGITSTSSSELKQLQFTPVIEEELILITSLNHPLKELEYIDFSKLIHENIVQYPNKGELQKVVLEAYHSVGCEPNGLYEVENLDAAYYLVKAGIAIAIVPETYFKYAYLNGIHFVRIKKPTVKRKIYIVSEEARYVPPSVKEFMTILVNYFSEV